MMSDYIADELEFPEPEIKSIEELKKHYRKKVSFVANKHVCEFVKVNEDTGEVIERGGQVYICSYGFKTKRFFVHSKEKIPVGNTEAVLRRMNMYEVAQMLAEWSSSSRDILFSFLEDKKINLIVKEVYTGMLKKEKEKEKMGEISEEVDKAQVIIQVLASMITWYKVEESFSLEVVEKCSKELINEAIERYLTSVYEIDPRLKTIMKGGLVEFPNPADYNYLAKYRGHALLIKNPKAGVSSISERIGVNLDATSFASLEGFADAEGNLYYSILHNTAQHINFDEFLMMKDLILQKSFNYLEVGQYTSFKATKKIENKGCARVIFTANPSDIDYSSDMLRRESGLEISGGQLEDMDRYENIPYQIFKKSILKLTNIIDASFSRLGVVLLTADLKTAKKLRDERESDTMLVELAKSVLYYLRPKFLKIFLESEQWLNKAIPEYSEFLDEVMKKTTDVAVKQSARGQKHAYRHIRGLALANALVDMSYYLLHIHLYTGMERAERGLFGEIYEKAIDELDDILSINKSTFTLLSNVDENMKELNIKLLRDKYRYMDIFFYTIEETDKNIEELTFDEWKQKHHELVEAGKIQGKYARLNELVNKMNNEKSLRNLRIANLYDVVKHLL